MPANLIRIAMANTPEQIQLQKALSYANGYRELRMFADANAELDTLPKTQHSSEPVLQMKLAIAMDSETWIQAKLIAKKLLDHNPTTSGHYINYAYATRRAESIEAAKWVLLDAVSKFPSEALIHYNLGCYECQAGQLKEAKNRLLVAFSLDAKHMKMAAEDEDLKALREWIANLDKKTD